MSFISWVREFVPLVVDDPLLSTMASEQISCLFIRLYKTVLPKQRVMLLRVYR